MFETSESDSMSLDVDEISLILSGVKILQDLDVEIIHSIARHIGVEHFAQGDKIVEKGQLGRRIYFIYQGKIEVQVPATNGDINNRILLKKGAVVGEISLLVNSTYSADIVAVTDTTALYLDQEQFGHLIEHHAGFSEVMTRLMTERMAQNGGTGRRTAEPQPWNSWEAAPGGRFWQCR